MHTCSQVWVSFKIKFHGEITKTVRNGVYSVRIDITTLRVSDQKGIGIKVHFVHLSRGSHLRHDFDESGLLVVQALLYRYVK